jgi:hypothetical protein
MFYTDTNGQTPSKKCFALVLLEAALEQRLPYEVNIEGFNDLRANLEYSGGRSEMEIRRINRAPLTLTLGEDS